MQFAQTVWIDVRTKLLVLVFLFLSVVQFFCHAAETSKAAEVRNFGQIIELIRKNQLLKRDDLANLTAFELRMARNIIYARHGRPFGSLNVYVFFLGRDWYHQDNTYTDERLSSNDQANINLVQKAEQGAPFQPDNNTIEGAMRLYLESFFKGDSDMFLKLCHREHPPRFIGYEIGSMKHLGASVINIKELEADFAKKDIQWTNYFGMTDTASYRWTVTKFIFDEWIKDGDSFRRPEDGKYIYVKWQKLDGRWYLAEFSDIMV